MNTLTDTVRDALAAPSAPEAVIQIKQAVCDELALTTDPPPSLHSTPYFNHTFMPDIVLSWPESEPREVFLRFVSSPSQMLADAKTVGASAPIIVDLFPAVPTRGAEDGSDTRRAAAQAATAAAPNLLITNSDAIQHVRPAADKNMLETLVVGDLMRHGRGNLDEQAARDAIEWSRAGYAGAIAIDAQRVHETVTAAERLLAPDAAQRVRRTLQLLWWMAGGNPARFPIDEPDDPQLDPTDTRYFLREVLSDKQTTHNDDFWSRLADQITFDMLVEAGEFPESENLQRLMEHLAGRLVLSHAILNTREHPGQLGWRLDNRFLCLRGPHWECWFTPHGNRFSQRRRDSGRPIPLLEAHSRSQAYLVVAAEIDEADRQVVFNRKANGRTIREDRTLLALAGGFGDEASVRTLTVDLEGSHITADFERMMVSADPDVTVRRIAFVAAETLSGLNAREAVLLDSFLGS